MDLMTGQLDIYLDDIEKNYFEIIKSITPIIIDHLLGKLEKEKYNQFALIMLGFIYKSGKCVPKNFSKAVQMYVQAIEYGNKSALLNIMNIYKYSDYFENDRAGFIEILELSINKGITEAEQILIDLFQTDQLFRKLYIFRSMHLNKQNLFLQEKISDLKNSLSNSTQTECTNNNTSSKRKIGACYSDAELISNRKKIKKSIVISTSDIKTSGTEASETEASETEASETEASETEASETGISVKDISTEVILPPNLDLPQEIHNHGIKRNRHVLESDTLSPGTLLKEFEKLTIRDNPTENSDDMYRSQKRLKISAM